MSASLEIHGLDELLQNMNTVINEYQDTAEKHLNKAGNKLKKMVKEASPDSGTTHKKKLNKSWKSKVTGTSAEDTEYQLWSTAPHYHLVARGHVIKTPGGKVKGFRQGNNFLQKAVDQFSAEDIAGKELEKLAKDIKKKIDGGH